MQEACFQKLVNCVLGVKNLLPGVVCIVENWLSEEIMDLEISLPDYYSALIPIDMVVGCLCMFIRIFFFARSSLQDHPGWNFYLSLFIAKVNELM